MTIRASQSSRMLLTAAAALVALAGCSRGEEEDGADTLAAPTPELTGNPVMTEAPDGSPMTPGEWVIGEDANGAQARFGPPASEPVFAMECDTASQSLTLTRAGGVEEGAAETEQSYILEAGGERARVAMAPTGGQLPMLRAEINRAMPIFANFSQLGNVITVTGPDGMVLRMQGAPGIRRVIEACSQ